MAIVLCALTPGTSAAARSGTLKRSPVGDARVLGAFQMSARVTAARNVRGERRGEVLSRSWTLTPQSCAGSVCSTLLLVRERSAGIHEALTLNRVRAGVYLGASSFYVPLRCRGRVHPHGSRAPYRITITVASAEAVQGIAFARQITATYVNRRRSDTTRCPLGPSHDAAKYTGTAVAPAPTPPTASFAAQPGALAGSVAFTDTSALGGGGAPIISRRWDFGDPASGAADASAEAAPTHRFSAPGSHTVTLTVTDANGLTGTAAVEIQA